MEIYQEVLSTELIRDSSIFNYTDVASFCIDRNFTYTPSYLYTNFETVNILIILPLLLFLAILTNLVFIIVVARAPRMRTTTNIYLVSLALADLLYTIIGITEKLHAYIRSPIYFDSAYSLDLWCAVMPLLKNAGLFASMFLVTVFSYERYEAVCHPLTKHSLSSKRRALKHITIACVLALILAATTVPAFANRVVACLKKLAEDEHSDIPDTIILCTPVKQRFELYNDFVQTLPFFLVMIFSNAAYVLIIIEIRGSARDAKLKRADSSRVIQESINITRMLIVNGVVFFILMAPFHILSLSGVISSIITGEYLLSEEAFRWIIQVVRVLAYCNAVVDPVIYSAVNPSYRKAMYQVICSLHILRRKRSNSFGTYSMSYLLTERDRRPSNVNETIT
ncbi:thyrotropin-releasing hormone receptor-like [Antedon mediterranea]|uniref:thyrotropin-releasing hormone receptor-like n=1 Tax=Antedon mediterranea TaxID=105859 RepID=UPI003AF9C4DE